MSVLPVGQKAGKCIVQRTLRQSIHINYVHVLCIDVTKHITSVESYYVHMYTHVSERFHNQVNQIPECTYIHIAHSQ